MIFIYYSMSSPQRKPTAAEQNCPQTAAAAFKVRQTFLGAFSTIKRWRVNEHGVEKWRLQCGIPHHNTSSAISSRSSLIIVQQNRQIGLMVAKIKATTLIDPQGFWDWEMRPWVAFVRVAAKTDLMLKRWELLWANIILSLGNDLGGESKSKVHFHYWEKDHFALFISKKRPC